MNGGTVCIQILYVVGSFQRFAFKCGKDYYYRRYITLCILACIVISAIILLLCFLNANRHVVTSEYIFCTKDYSFHQEPQKIIEWGTQLMGTFTMKHSFSQHIILQVDAKSKEKNMRLK